MGQYLSGAEGLCAGCGYGHRDRHPDGPFANLRRASAVDRGDSPADSDRGLDSAADSVDRDRREAEIAVIALGTFWSVLLNTIHGIQSVDPKLPEVAAALEKDRGVILRRIVLPSALPSMITGIRLGLGSAWASVVAAEMIAASKGVGYMIMMARELVQSAKLMVGIFTIGLVGLLFDQAILLIEKKVVRWQ